MKRIEMLVVCLLVMLSYSTIAQVNVEVDFNQEPVEMSDALFGAFFEDINYAADGGLYAELVQNRSFEYYPVPGYTDMGLLEAWSAVQAGDASVSISVENETPLNSNNTNYLNLTVNKSGTLAGVQNTGFDGIAVKPGAKYDFSVYLRQNNTYNGSVIVQLKTSFGSVFMSDTIRNIGTTWKKYELELESTKMVKDARLQLITDAPGTVLIDMVSFFPQDTYKGRKNGLRKDLAQVIEDLEPKFLRFPGGCISHGRGLDNAYRWKETVGDVAERKPNWNLWGYHQTYGLGFYEYFLFSEDLGAKPLPVVPVGISCQFRQREIAPLNEMQEWIDDATDLIEFANGSVDTKWGAVRAQMGHPEPFNMEYICLGNEEDNIPEFRERFMMITNAIRELYPEIKVIGTSGTDDTGYNYHSLWEFSRENNVDAVDEHYYNDPEWFLQNVHRYDNFDRSGPTVFIGEYASRDDRLFNAIAEAAYLTGVEKNADIIEFTCYAPLFSNVEHQQWHPDLIRFNNTEVVKTASYYVQQMYSVNAGSKYYASNISYTDDVVSQGERFNGMTGLGTWNTQAEFDDLKITVNDELLYDETFESAGNWNVISGSFATKNGVYVQSSTAEPALSVYQNNIEADNYTITLRARKTGGNEGFLIPFGLKDNDNYFWLNIAGWGNTQHAVERVTNGNKNVLYTRGGEIQNNQWYDIKIEVEGGNARCYLDGEMIFDIPESTGPVTASVTEDETGDIIVKLVNSESRKLTTNVTLEGVELVQNAELTVLTGSFNERNSMEQQSLIVPETKTIEVSSSFEYDLPPYSFHVIRIKKAGNGSSLIKKADDGYGDSKIKVVPNPANTHARIIFDNPGANSFDLSFINIEGKKVMAMNNITGDEVTIERGNLPSGAYVVQLSYGSTIYSEKLMFN
ncbi:MAG: carbohydrate binding domain-containing protein [Prolixibacteraceae bacterium]|nr:carbohydrate binding domain-containing protein [Prolixibacteraceae bacterium]